MNCAATPFTDGCRFQQPTTETPEDLAARIRTRKLVKNSGKIEERLLLVHFLPPPLSLAGIKGGHCTADVFALLCTAQLIERDNVKFHMPSVCRRWNRTAVQWAAGATMLTIERTGFTKGHSQLESTTDDKNNHVAIARACFDGFGAGIRQWERAVAERIAEFKLTVENEGDVSLCFSISEAVAFLDDNTTISHTGHVVCDDGKLPQEKLRSSVRDMLYWFNTHHQTVGIFDRLFFLVHMAHKPVLLICDKNDQALIAIDPRLAPHSEIDTPSTNDEAAALHILPWKQIDSGCRVAVCGVGNVSLMCTFICKLLLRAQGGASEEEDICFDYFVAGDEAAFGDSWE